MNATYNAAIDYYGLQTATSNKLKLKSSAENRSDQTASGANCYGDTVVMDKYGETAAPSVDYDVIGEVAHDPSAPGTTLVTLGTVNTPTGISKPVVLGTLSISTLTGSAPSVSASGQMVQTGAAQLRAYKLPAFTLLPRHRAQDFMGLIAVKKGTDNAAPVQDYSFESVNAVFPIEFTIAQPQGVTQSYDLHGGMATVDFTMNWYSSTAPTIELTSAALALGAELSTPSRTDPDNGYSQYTWQVTFPFVGEEYVPPTQS